MRNFKLVIMAVMVAGLVALAGCKGQQQMQQQMADLNTKVDDAQKRTASMDAEIKKTKFEVDQLKGLVTKLSEVVLNLQKSEDERQAKARAAAEAAAAKAAKAKPGPKKAAPAKPKKKG